MYSIAVPLVSTDSADVAREIVDNWVLKFGAPIVLHTDQGKNVGGKMIEEMCRLLGIVKTQTSPYKPKENGRTRRHNAKMAEVVLNFCAENTRMWDTTLPYLNFVYNTTINRKTGATPFCLVHGEECQYPVDLFFAKPHDEMMMRDGFAELLDIAEWLDKQFRDAHSSARELLETDQSRQKSYYWKKIHGEPYASGDKVWVWSQETSKSKKSFDLWEGPYVLMARLSEVRYKLSKVSNPSRVKFLHFDMLKRYNEETLRPEDTLARKRPTPYWSATFLMLRRGTIKTRRFGQTTARDSTMIQAQGKNFWGKKAAKKSGMFKLPRAGAMSELQGSFFPAELQRQQASKRDQLT